MLTPGYAAASGFPRRDALDDSELGANIVITPLALLGGVFYSARTLSKP